MPRYDIVKSHMDGFYTYFASNGFTYGSTWKNWESLSRFDVRSSTMKKFLTKKYEQDMNKKYYEEIFD